MQGAGQNGPETRAILIPAARIGRINRLGRPIRGSTEFVALGSYDLSDIGGALQPVSKDKMAHRTSENIAVTESHLVM